MRYGSGCMNLPPLTPAQQRLLDAVIHHLETHNVTPTTHQLMEQLDLTSTNAIAEVVNRLKKKGYLTTNRRIQLSDAYRLIVEAKYTTSTHLMPPWHPLLPD